MKKDIKILILPSWYPPDGGGFFKDHAESLHTGEYKVDVLVNRVLGISTHSLHHLLHARKVTESREGPLRVIRSGFVRWPKLEKYNVKAWVRKYLALYEYYIDKYGSPDIIIAHSAIWAGYVAAVINEKYGVPYLLVEHRSRFARDIEATQRMIREWYFPYIRSTLVRAEKVITVSEAIDIQLISISPGIRNKIITIPNLIDTDFFIPPVEKRKSQPFVFLAVGILEYVKGFDVLIEAFAGFIAMNKGEFLLRIGGRGSNFRKLRLLAKRHGVSEWVNLRGYVPREQVRREMQQSNVFVLPSRFEAFGVVLIEAMATGCPVISTYSGGPEFIVNGKNGILVEPDSAEQLQDAMQYLYNNYESYNQDEIRKHVVDNYSVDVIRHRYYDLIKKVLHGKNKPSE